MMEGFHLWFKGPADLPFQVWGGTKMQVVKNTNVTEPL